MAHESFDPRDTIRETIGTQGYNFDLEEEYYTVNIVDADNITLKVPIYDEEEVKSGEQPQLPFISLKLAYIENDPHNVGATVRKFTAYIDVDVAYTATENINIKDFGKKIKNELHDKIRTYQATITGVFFMNIDSERYIDEIGGRQVVFHYILTLMANYSDAC